MSDKPKIKHADALVVGQAIINMLAPACQRIAIAGSLRRGKPEVGDIEILFSPVYTSRPDGLFDKKIVSVAEEVIEGLLIAGYFDKRRNIRGNFTWGEANKLAIHRLSGMPVDLFSVPMENWFVSLVIRTGSKATNLRLTTAAQAKGAKLNAYGYGVTWSDGTTTAATSEENVFELCGVPYLAPEKR